MLAYAETATLAGAKGPKNRQLVWSVLSRLTGCDLPHMVSP